MRHWLRGDGGIVEKHCVGRRRCDLSEYLIRLVPIGASLISCKQAEILGVQATELTELAAATPARWSGPAVPPTRIAAFRTTRRAPPTLRPTSPLTLVPRPSRCATASS